MTNVKPDNNNNNNNMDKMKMEINNGNKPHFCLMEFIMIQKKTSKISVRTIIIHHDM
jgi:hypothetical protein